MAGNMRYESSSASPEELGFAGSYPNVQKGNYPNASSDRSGSYREGSESRSFGSGASTPRASASSEVGSITQYLLLDPITMGDQKYTRSGDLRRVLGISFGNATEDNSFGAAHSKPPPPVATEEVKRVKASISESALRARIRHKRFNESLLNLNKYFEASNLKKQHRNEMLVSERSGTSNFMKMGIQIHRNASDLGTQRLEERNKNIVLNKRVRSSVAELRADSRSNTLPRQQLGIDREMLREGGGGSDLSEDKVRRMPARGEGWDRKMKRKRSVGSVFARSTDNDGDAKRIMHHKFNNEPGLQAHDGHGFSTGSLNGTNGINKLDGSSLPANSNPRSVLKNESGKVSMTRDFADGLNKEHLVSKENNKLNFLEENHTVGPTPVLKGKALRTPRTGSVTAANSSNFSRSSGAPDSWDQLPSINKVNSFAGASNRKRSMPAGSSSPPMAQWVGQRPQKISRTRRANVVSPVSNHDDVQMSSEGGHIYPSDFASRLTSAGSNGSLLATDMTNENQLAKVKHENISSPARFSESEESGAGANHEGRHKEKRKGSCGVEERSQNQSVDPSVVHTKKNGILNREDTGDGLRRQGRTGRGALFSRANVSPVREKLDHPASAKPIRSVKPVSEINGSKSGRPLKKISDCKSFTRGQTSTVGSPDFTGELDDDREELLAAANYACNASYLCCSSTFWKKMEPFFASPSLEDLLYLKQQLKSEELHHSMFDMSSLGNNTLGDLVHQEDLKSHLLSGESKKCLHERDWPKMLTSKNMITQGLENGSSCGSMEGINQVIPLYQRVLSGLIVEDESKDFEENSLGRNLSFQSSRDRCPSDTCPPIHFEPSNKDRIDFDYDFMLGVQAQKPSAVDGLSCNGNATINRAASGFHNQLHKNNFFEGGQGFINSKITEFSEYLGDIDSKLSVETNTSCISALDGQHLQTCLEDRLLMELQSIGLYLEIVPDLADGEDDAINQDIVELQKGFLPQVAEKKAHLEKIMKTVEEGKKVEAGALEQVAMDKLVELAYKKLWATRGSCASKFGVPRVPKQIALAFMKRTLARCRKFEDTGRSCFGEPPLRDVLLAAPPCGNSAASRAEQHDLHNEKSGGIASAAVGNLTRPHNLDFAKSGPLLGGGKKKELLLDDVGVNASFRATPSLGNALLTGTKGKRSERERDKDAMARNPVNKGGRVSQSNVKGDRKTKSKPKQKTAQLSTSGDGMSSKFKDPSSNKKREASLNSYGYNPQSSSKESRGTADINELQDLSLELGIANDIGSHQDLSNLFNFDEDGLPENDLMGLDLPLDGLEIPMDDLSELNMLL